MAGTHVCILGAGGLGSVIGACLAESGTSVTMIARPPHANAIQGGGLRVVGIRGDRLVRKNLRAVSDPDAVESDIDFLMLLVKTRDSAAALAGARGLRDRTAAVLSFQNSSGKDKALADWAGASRVVGASTTEAGTLIEPGLVRHTATAPVAFYFGELDGRPSERVDNLVDLFTSAGLSARATATIAEVEWEKVLSAALVAAFSITTVGFLPDATMTDTLRIRTGAEHYAALATELLAIYKGLGFEPRDYFAPFSQFCKLSTATFEEAVAQAMDIGHTMAAAGVRGRPSMHDDLLRHRPTEVEESVGAFVRAADRLNIAAPTLRAAYRIVRTYQSLVTEKESVDVPG